MQGPAHGRHAMARAVGWLIGGGAAMVAFWLLFPHPARVHVNTLLVLVALTWAVALVLLTGRLDRRPRWMLDATIVVVIALITAALLAIGDPHTGFAIYYACLAPYVFGSGPLRRGVLLLGAIGLAYAAALAVMVSDDRRSVVEDAFVGHWLVVMGSAVALGLFARYFAHLRWRSEVRFRKGFADSPVGMAIISEDWRWLEVNDALCTMLGRPAEELVGHSPEESTFEADREPSRENWARALRGSGPQHFVKRYVRPDGAVVVAAVQSVHVQGGRDGGWIYAHIRDITAQRAAEEAVVRQARQQAAAAALGRFALGEQDLEVVCDHVATTVADTLGAELCGVWAHEDEHASGPLLPVGGTGFGGPGPTLAQEPDGDVPEALQAEGARAGIMARVPLRTGTWGVLGAYVREPRAFHADEVDFLVAVANVVSSAVERSRADAEIRHRALHDPLTGLPNRALALDRLESALARRARDVRPVGVLLIDLDHFKMVNDSLGHSTGDELLVALAPRLRDAVRPGDTVARLGGDEFLIVCDRLDDARAAITVAERVAQAVARPIPLSAGEQFVSASIGIALADTADADPAALIRDADVAMYRAKERGRGRYELFDDKLRQRVLGRMRTEHELRRAIDDGELRVFYQPVVDVASGTITAVEALVRWEHPERGLLEPLDFISVAEDSGLIAAIGDRVLALACRDAAGWQRRFRRDDPVTLCVNVSPRELANPAFPARVAEAMDRHELAAGSLALEITENVLMDDAHAPVTMLTSLRDYGLRLVLDDFGTGYSSLAYLKRFPLDVLKIDRSFVAGLDASEDDAAIVAAVVQLARTLGLGVVAEGVERPQQLDHLRALGCDRVQGWLTGRPMPADELEALMASAPA